jgi:hypothetical protein
MKAKGQEGRALLQELKKEGTQGPSLREVEGLRVTLGLEASSVRARGN